MANKSGRPPIGGKAMSGAERQARFRAARAARAATKSPVSLAGMGYRTYAEMYGGPVPTMAELLGRPRRR
jgi:hypothetical protein